MGQIKRAAKLSDVAREASVSIATASIILNNPEKDRFSESTRTRVRRAAEQVHYTHPAGTAPRKRERPIVGLVIPDLANQFYPEITSAFSRKANEQGYQVMILDMANSFQKERDFIRILLQMRVAGVAICGACEKDEAEEQKLIRQILRAGIPAVQFDRYTQNTACPYVGIDNYHAGLCMTARLIQAGHRSIALLRCREVPRIVLERQRGYEDAMARYGLTPHIITYAQGCFGSIYQELYKLMHPDRRCTALFAIGGDVEAIECIRASGKMGFRVPQDLSIAGFDDVSMAEVINPGLTTISQPKAEIGETAMGLLASMIRRHTLTENNILLPFECLVRESTLVILDGEQKFMEQERSL